VADDNQSYIYIDIDLSGNTYTKLDDRISRNVINIITRLDDVESALPDLDQPVLMDLKTFWDWRMGADGKNWGLGNYFPYKILGIDLYTSTERQKLDTKLDDSLYYFERHEDVLSDDADFDLSILKTNDADSQHNEVEIYRNDNGDYNNKVTVTLGEYNPKAFIRIVFQDQAAANLAKSISIRWNVEQEAFEPKLSKFPYVVEVVKAKTQAPYMSTDVFCVSQRQDGQLEDGRYYVYTKNRIG